MRPLPGIRTSLRTAATVLATLGFVSCQLHELGANLVLHPPRKHVRAKAPEELHEITIRGNGIAIRGWQGDAEGARSGTIVYLHGIADNRESGAGVMRRFKKRGFDVIACDSRAHGNSGGDTCTYGILEKDDLDMILNVVKPGPVILIGSSLGAAVALQHAARDPRVTGIVAAECFSDLRTVATERAPFFFSTTTTRRALDLVEAKGRFPVNEANPAAAAKRVQVPVLLVHGALDTDTTPDHSLRIQAALAGRGELVIIPGARHNQSLSGGEIWERIERWVDAIITSAGTHAQER